MIRILAFALLFSGVSAFTSSLPRAFVRQAETSTTARFILLSDEETNVILQSAQDCADSECSVDDVDMLLADLKEQERLLQDRMTQIMNMIAHLQHANEKDERKTDEVRAFVKDMLRVFSHDAPMFPATGFSGDIGSGSTTAYDALPPKPWKPSSN